MNPRIIVTSSAIQIDDRTYSAPFNLGDLTMLLGSQPTERREDTLPKDTLKFDWNNLVARATKTNSGRFMVNEIIWYARPEDPAVPACSLRINNTDLSRESSGRELILAGFSYLPELEPGNAYLFNCDENYRPVSGCISGSALHHKEGLVRVCMSIYSELNSRSISESSPEPEKTSFWDYVWKGLGEAVGRLVFVVGAPLVLILLVAILIVIAFCIIYFGAQ